MIKLIKSLYKEKIRWQSQTKRKKVAQLLANKKIIDLLLKFLKLTKVNKKKETKVKKIE